MKHMTKVSKACVVKFMANRLWKWITPEIYFALVIVALIAVLAVLTKLFGVYIAAATWFIATACMTTYLGAYNEDDQWAIAMAFLGSNLVPIGVMFAYADDTPVTWATFVVGLMTFLPLVAAAILTIARHMYGSYLAAVEYCTPKEM